MGKFCILGLLRDGTLHDLHRTGMIKGTSEMELFIRAQFCGLRLGRLVGTTKAKANPKKKTKRQTEFERVGKILLDPVQQAVPNADAPCLNAGAIVALAFGDTLGEDGAQCSEPLPPAFSRCLHRRGARRKRKRRKKNQ